MLIGTIFGVSSSMKMIVRLLLVLSILYGLVVFLEVFLICRPMAVDWNAQIDGTCGDQIVSYLVLEVLGLLLNFSVLMAPLQCIWRLQMERATKMSISTPFSVGVL